MTLFPIDQVRGRHLVDKQVFSLTDADIVPIEIAMTAYDGALNGARLVNIAGRPAYILLGENGPQMELEGIQKLDKAPKDYAGALPVWQVKFTDKAKTRLYIDPNTAEVLSVRTRLWRVFDLAWKFHIMDVTGEDIMNLLT